MMFSNSWQSMDDACRAYGVGRRTFMKSGMAFAGMAGAGFNVFGDTVKPPDLRVGLLADTHLRLPPSTFGTQKLEAAFRRFDAEKVDAVLVAGDLTDFGLIPELRIFADTWYKVFPDDRRSDGTHVEKLFIYGDHDTGRYIHERINETLKGYPHDKEEINKLVIPFGDRGQIWKDFFHEDWAPVMKKTVKGYDFVLVHHAQGEPDNLWGSRAPALKPFYDAYTPDQSRPFFHVQHRVCSKTAYVPGHANCDDGESTRVLSRFPNCFAFCGHAHTFFNNDRSLWQGAYTLLEIPSLSYICVFTGRENAGSTKAQREAGYVPQMDTFPFWLSRQGMIADIYGDRIVLSRIDLEAPPGSVFGPDWTVPLPLGKEKPFEFSALEARVPVPQFPPDAKLQVKSGKGKNRKKEKVDQVTVTFPTILASSTGPRVFDYEVTATGDGGEKVVKRVYSEKFWRAECVEPKLSKCVFACSELPKGEVVFSARPANSFGKAGKAIECKM